MDSTSLNRFNAPIAPILMEIKNEDFVKWLEKIKLTPYREIKTSIYEFHKDHGHNTEECFQLKKQIVDLIKNGYLRKFVVDSPDRGYVDNMPIAGDIQTIH